MSQYSYNYENNKSVPLNQAALAKHVNFGKSWYQFWKTDSPDNEKMKAELSKTLGLEGEKLLKNLEQNGKLYSKESNDGSSTIENLYKIATTPRVDHFDKKNILIETLKTLNDPYLITQNFGNVPVTNINDLLVHENLKLSKKIQQTMLKKNQNPDDIGDLYPIKPYNILNIHSATCSASSIEFNLADRNPAEFVRYVEGLTSPERCVKTKLKFSDLSPDMTEALNALISQKSDFKTLDWENVEVTIRPDSNAYFKADIQEDFREQNTRSMIDVLMQSAFMQLGSRKTYNSLTDRRSLDVGDGGGLNQFEIAFVESIVDSKSKKIPMVYMTLNDDLTKVTQYSHSFEEIKNQFIRALDNKTNIITGFLVDVDQNGNVAVPQGHEILITGYEYKNGELWFKYNDSDDGAHFDESWMKADPFIPKIHHANITQKALKKEPEHTSIGYLYLQDYLNMKNEKKMV